MLIEKPILTETPEGLTLTAKVSFQGREVNALDLFRARLLNGRIHSFIRGNPLLKRLAKKFFK